MLAIENQYKLAITAYMAGFTVETAACLPHVERSEMGICLSLLWYQMLHIQCFKKMCWCRQWEWCLARIRTGETLARAINSSSDVMVAASGVGVRTWLTGALLVHDRGSVRTRYP